MFEVNVKLTSVIIVFLFFTLVMHISICTGDNLHNAVGNFAHQDNFCLVVNSTGCLLYFTFSCTCPHVLRINHVAMHMHKLSCEECLWTYLSHYF